MTQTEKTGDIERAERAERAERIERIERIEGIEEIEMPGWMATRLLPMSTLIQSLKSQPMQTISGIASSDAGGREELLVGRKKR